MLSKNSGVFSAILITFLGLGAPLCAASIVGPGDFNLSGSIYVAQNAFLFGYHAVPTASSSDQLAAVLVPATGSWGSLKSGQLAGMKDLLTPGNGAPFGPGPVVPGSDFLLSKFLTLPNGINVDLTGLPVNLSVPVCGGPGENQQGYVCRVQPGSPVVLQQSATGVFALLNLVGRAYYGNLTETTPLIGTFSANFSNAPDQTISGLLDDFYSKGYLATGFSANFSVGSPIAVPEPRSIALLGAGLLGLLLFRIPRRRISLPRLR